MSHGNYPFIEKSFENLAIKLFKHQARENKIYKTWLESLGWGDEKINAIDTLTSIPFLPITAFKSQKVVTGSFTPDAIYTSSGAINSQHFVSNKNIYLRNAQMCFESFYGPVKDYAWLCLLPGYLDRSGSSLIDMAEYFISISNHSESGFFVKGIDELKYRLENLDLNRVPTILLGVTFALMDLAESIKNPMKLNHTIIMETGGMKGRREEPIREELHHKLNSSFGTKEIHSEYGMTELLSQAYSFKDGLFSTPAQMLVLPRSIETPLLLSSVGEICGLNIIDLANSDSCAFLATDDMGRVHENGNFEVLGRIDGSDQRGCSLLSINSN